MNETDYPAEYVAARAVLLDALLALEHHLPAIIVVGAQAVYLHTGAGEFVEPPMTTDGDLALDAASLGCEGEHIWANHPRRYFDEFEHAADHRNLIGDPLLLPKKSDASYGDMTFGKKLPDFTAQAVLDRGTLYQQVAQHIWNPATLLVEG